MYVDKHFPNNMSNVDLFANTLPTFILSKYREEMKDTKRRLFDKMVAMERDVEKMARLERKAV